MPQGRLDHGFVFVRDLDVVARFYEGAFAMRADPDQHEDLVVMTSPWAKVVLHRQPEAMRGERPTGEAPWRDDVAYKLSFATDDIEAQRQAILAHGGQAGSPWSWNGTSYCECTDPEGNVVQIFASPERLARRQRIETLRNALPVEGVRVRLRPFTVADVERRYALDGPDAAHAKLNAPHHPRRTAEAVAADRAIHHRFVEHGDDVGGGHRVVIAESTSDRYLGDVTSYVEDPHGGYLSVGVVLRDETTWQRGFGTEALELWVGLLFDLWDLHAVRLGTWSGNAGMLALARRLGFVEEGRRRECIPVDGVWHDEVSFSVLQTEWRHRPA